MYQNWGTLAPTRHWPEGAVTAAGVELAARDGHAVHRRLVTHELPLQRPGLGVEGAHDGVTARRPH